MLYLVYVIFAILQTSFAFPASPTEPLVSQLIEALPLKQIQELKETHLKNDPGFQAAVKMMKSPEWLSAVQEVRKSPEWIEYKNFVKKAGLDFDYLIQHMEHCMNKTDVTGFNVDGVKPNLTNFIEDVKMTYGLQILKGMHGFIENVQTNTANRALTEQMTSAKSKELLEKARKQPALVNLSKKLQEVGINVDVILEVVNSFMEKH